MYCCVMPFIIFQSSIHVQRRNQIQTPYFRLPEENYPAQISRNCFQFYLPWFLGNRLFLPSFRNAGNMQPEGAALHQESLSGMVLLANSLQLYYACSTH